MPKASQKSKALVGKSKYAELVDGIVARIESGELKACQRIPSENELISEFGVSNTTARRALLELKNRGWVRKVKGSGTFVSEMTPEKKLVRQLGSFTAICSNFSTNLEREGYKPSLKILEKKILRGGIQIGIGCITYEIKNDALKIRFLRYADGILLKDETKYLNLSIFPDAESKDFTGTAELLFQSQTPPKIGTVLRDISAAISSGTPDGKFFADTPTALITLEGVTLCTDGRVAEIELSYYRADKYKFFVSAENAE